MPRQNSFMEILTPTGDGISRWGLWKLLRTRGWSPHDWVSALTKEPLKKPLSPSETQPEVCNLQEVPLLTMLAPWSRTSRLQNCEQCKCLLLSASQSVVFYCGSLSRLRWYSPQYSCVIVNRSDSSITHKPALTCRNHSVKGNIIINIIVVNFIIISLLVVVSPQCHPKCVVIMIIFVPHTHH